jgi:hypothetical protein
MAAQNRDRQCNEEQVNRKVPDFHCNMRAGHTDAHTDPDTGIRWKHRGQRPFRGTKKH